MNQQRQSVIVKYDIKDQRYDVRPLVGREWSAPWGELWPGWLLSLRCVPLLWCHVNIANITIQGFVNAVIIPEEVVNIIILEGFVKFVILNGIVKVLTVKRIVKVIVKIASSLSVKWFRQHHLPIFQIPTHLESTTCRNVATPILNKTAKSWRMKSCSIKVDPPGIRQ